MQITKIPKINARTYKGFDWPADLPEFKDFNLIYGWNGSGKTTLSDMLQMVEKRQAAGVEGITDFNITYDGRIIASVSIGAEQAPPSIRVFNRRFIEQNVFAQSGAAPVLFIGESTIEKQKELAGKKANLTILQLLATKTASTAEAAETQLHNFAKDKATQVRAWLGIPSQNTYNRAHFISMSETLSNDSAWEQYRKTDEEISTLKDIAAGEIRPEISLAPSIVPNLSTIGTNVRNLLQQTVVSKAIERLSTNPEIAEWVKSGLDIHKKHEGNKCEFCEQTLPQARIQDLEAHFNNQYLLLDSALTTQIAEIDSAIADIGNATMADPIQLYIDLIDSYEVARNKIKLRQQEYIDFLKSAREAVQTKQTQPFSKISFDINRPDNIADALSVIEQILSAHNARTQNFKATVSEARKNIEKAVVANNLLEYQGLSGEAQKLKKAAEDATASLVAEDLSIKALEQDIIEHKKPAEELNADLESYLGHSELRFETGEHDTGYIIKRGDQPAQALSEGERTAVALLHFLKSLQDKNFDLEKGIVVIDDPVCSLDDTSLFHAFGFIKQRAKKAKQLFILTHNFAFFRQVKNWFDHVKKDKKVAALYQTECFMKDGTRHSRIKELDPLLKKYNSEYHYLFSLVQKTSKSPSAEGLEHYYHMPNIARRLLEAFLAFRIPEAAGLYHKVDMISLRSFAYHFMPAGGTRILDLQPVHKTIHVEGMSALKNRVLLTFLKVLPADRALAIFLQLFCVDL